MRLEDLDARRGPDAVRARLDHRERGVQIANPPCRLPAAGRTDGRPHKTHALDRGAARAEPRRGLHEVRARFDRDATSPDDLEVIQMPGLEDDLDDRAPLGDLGDGLRDGMDVVPDESVVPL